MILFFISGFLVKIFSSSPSDPSALLKLQSLIAVRIS